MTEADKALLKESKKQRQGKGNVDAHFWRSIGELIKKVIPSWYCYESRLLMIQACLLVVRTMMSIWLADVNGRVVKAIVDKDLAMFIRRVSTFSLYHRLFCDKNASLQE